jgi:hypothetical protein
MVAPTRLLAGQTAAVGCTAAEPRARARPRQGPRPQGSFETRHSRPTPSLHGNRRGRTWRGWVSLSRPAREWWALRVGTQRGQAASVLTTKAKPFRICCLLSQLQTHRRPFVERLKPPTGDVLVSSEFACCSEATLSFAGLGRGSGLRWLPVAAPQAVGVMSRTAISSRAGGLRA